MNTYRHLAPGAYLVAAALALFPLFDSGISLSPWNVGSAQWRFGAIGLLSNTLMIVALGMLLAVAAAGAASHDRTRRVLGIASWIVSALLLVAIAAFALDAVQARAQIRSDMMFSYQLASVTAGVKLLVGALSFALFGKGSRLDSPIRQDAVSPAPVLVGKRERVSQS